MITIHKYELEAVDIQNIPMPLGADLLHVESQLDSPRPVEFLCLWARVDTDAPKAGRMLLVRGTGQPLGLAESARYVGTAQMTSGLVWHVFDLGYTSGKS